MNKEVKNYLIQVDDTQDDLTSIDQINLMPKSQLQQRKNEVQQQQSDLAKKDIDQMMNNVQINFDLMQERVKQNMQKIEENQIEMAQQIKKDLERITNQLKNQNFRGHEYDLFVENIPQNTQKDMYKNCLDSFTQELMQKGLIINYTPIEEN